MTRVERVAAVAEGVRQLEALMPLDVRIELARREHERLNREARRG